MILKIIIKWNYKNDRSFNKLVEEGLKEPIIVDDEMSEREWLYLREVVFLSKAQGDTFFGNLDTILQYSYYNEDNKKVVSQFINYVLGKSKLKKFVEQQLKDYEVMTCQAKMKLIKDLLTEMFQEKKDK